MAEYVQDMAAHDLMRKKSALRGAAGSSEGQARVVAGWVRVVAECTEVRAHGCEKGPLCA